MDFDLQEHHAVSGQIRGEQMDTLRVPERDRAGTNAHRGMTQPENVA